MSIDSTLELISLVLSCVALYLLSIPYVGCYIIFLISFVLQSFIFYRKKQWFLLLQMAVLFAFNFYVYIEWIQKGIG